MQLCGVRRLDGFTTDLLRPAPGTSLPVAPAPIASDNPQETLP